MNVELYSSRIRPMFERRDWLLRSLICTVVFVAGLEPVFAQATRVQAERAFFSLLLETMSGWGLIGVVYQLTHDREDASLLGLGAILTIGSVLLAGKAAAKAGTLQIGKRKLLLMGSATFTVGAAGILIIVFAIMRAHSSYLNAQALSF
ncbi:MAG TPA: hypothetical protein VNO32_42185 [Candidatus Acidoferrum sp.]|jgi:hypothetical protein|nr:hypothetical protein [Candidatus Acidoferrum sp.]